ncbi:MAG: dihydrofolate reductase family protein [Microbacteriaceae bacterium]|nr:dihydrofolate reductase family protein [Microbacteriaceae bacterium]
MILRRVFAVQDAVTEGGDLRGEFDPNGPTSVGADRSGDSVSITNPDARERVSGWYEPPLPRWLRVNLITSVNGSVVGNDGTSDTLTNRADRLILGVLRRQADAILVGAESVRAEGYHLPKTATLVIVTESGNLIGHRLGSITAGRVLVLCPSAAIDTVVATVGDIPAEIIALPTTAGRLELASVVTLLRARGFENIVCEGGPSVAKQLLAAGLVDELCLSTSPRLTGGGLALLGSSDPGDSAPSDQRLRLAQLLVDDSSGVYARWMMTRD